MADLRADLLIIGGGVAGLCAALAAPADSKIVVIDKGEGAGSSPLAQGGLAAAIGAEDSVELHAEDTRKAGDGLCEQEVVNDICGEGPSVVARLSEWGARFDLNADGSMHLSREGGQSVARSVHHVDASGAELVRALRLQVADRDVTRVQTRASSLMVREGRCVGAVSGADRYFAGITLLATGGSGALWGATTNPPGAIGDGLVLAMMAGAQLSDLEFMQFHPTVLASGGAGTRVLLTEALRGEGATLLDAQGERFVDELAPRHVVADAIGKQGGAFLDARHLEDIETRFPTVTAAVSRLGFDLLTEPVPVEPAAHYYIGGVSTDLQGATSLSGLMAAGETAATGLHGANRLAGNSLLEAVVMGSRVGAGVGNQRVDTTSAIEPVTPLALPSEKSIRVLSEAAGPIRFAASLSEGASKLDAFHSAQPTPHTRFMGMILRAAIARRESRGVHIRSDFPSKDPDFAIRSFDRSSLTS